MGMVTNYSTVQSNLHVKSDKLAEINKHAYDSLFVEDGGVCFFADTKNWDNWVEKTLLAVSDAAESGELVIEAHSEELEESRRITIRPGRVEEQTLVWSNPVPW